MISSAYTRFDYSSNFAGNVANYAASKLGSGATITAVTGTFSNGSSVSFRPQQNNMNSNAGSQDELGSPTMVAQTNIGTSGANSNSRSQTNNSDIIESARVGDATQIVEDILDIAIRAGDEEVTVFARRVLNQGIGYNPTLDSNAQVSVSGGESSPNFGKIIIGPKFFGKGIPRELIVKFPTEAAELANQSLRVHQMFYVLHEIQHMTYRNRIAERHPLREKSQKEIDASKRAVDWLKRNGIYE